MKKLFLSIALLFLSLMAFNQEMTFRFPDKKENGDRDTTMVIDSLSFDIAISKNGALKVQRTSKRTGENYWQYLGYKTPYMLDGKMVLSDKDKENYWVLGLNKSGYIRKINIIAE